MERERAKIGLESWGAVGRPARRTRAVSPCERPRARCAAASTGRHATHVPHDSAHPGQRRTPRTVIYLQDDLADASWPTGARWGSDRANVPVACPIHARTERASAGVSQVLTVMTTADAARRSCRVSVRSFARRGG